MTKIFSLLFCVFANFVGFTQNVGIGIVAPTEKLEVAGNIKATGVMLTQGSQYDVAKKGVNNELQFSKGNKAVGINYIIATGGLFPTQGGSVTYSNTIIGEIRLFAGSFAPSGFLFCHGQLLTINGNLSLFSVLGTTYGGDGVVTFALPDLRGAAPVGAGTPVAGAAWTRGEVH